MMVDNVYELIRCLLRDLGTYAAAIDYADRIARTAGDGRYRDAYAAAANRLRVMRRNAEILATDRAPRPWQLT